MGKLAPVSRLKGMKRMPDEPKQPVNIPEPIQVEGYALIVDPLVSEIWHRLGDRPEDEGVAKRCAALSRALFKTYEGTIPELVTHDWLTQNNVPFEFQAFVYGGRNKLGGVIPDFVVWPGGRGLAWFIDTLYWHSKPEVAASDAVDRVRLLGAVVAGIRIEQVVSLWETRIYNSRPAVFQMALAGIEMGK